MEKTPRPHKSTSLNEASLPKVSGRRLFAASPEQQLAERETATKLTQYRRDYWQNYKRHIKRVFGTIDPRDYALWETLAAEQGRTVWGHIYACACAYLSGRPLASAEVLTVQTELVTELRRIGNNLNQAVRLGHIKAHKDGTLYANNDDAIGQSILSTFERLEQRLCQFETDVKTLAPSHSPLSSHPETLAKPSHDC